MHADGASINARDCEIISPVVVQVRCLRDSTRSRSLRRLPKKSPITVCALRDCTKNSAATASMIIAAKTERARRCLKRSWASTWA